MKSCKSIHGEESNHSYRKNTAAIKYIEIAFSSSPNETTIVITLHSGPRIGNTDKFRASRPISVKFCVVNEPSKSRLEEPRRVPVSLDSAFSRRFLISYVGPVQFSAFYRKTTASDSAATSNPAWFRLSIAICSSTEPNYENRNSRGLSPKISGNLANRNLKWGPTQSRNRSSLYIPQKVSRSSCSGKKHESVRD